MDSLSRLLINAQHIGLMRGIRASQNSNRINHLFFADDALLFIRNKQRDIEYVREILATFEAASGQQINLAKSPLFFSANTPNSQKVLYGNMLGMQVVEKLDSYLGHLCMWVKTKLMPFISFWTGSQTG